MAQTGSAQREPSMEEILASIRRIIQDSDSAQRPADDGPVFDVEAGDEAGGEDIDGLNEVEEFRAGLDEAAAATTASADPEPGDDAPGLAPPAGQVHAFRAPPPLTPPAPEAPRPVSQARQDDADFPDAFVAPLDAAPVDEPSAAFGEAVFPVSQPEETTALATGDQTDAALRPSIISDHAGRQVAAAFGELSEAFAASRRRSFDDLAQEMLRPMLQEWLDNNLPTLVEKLVREEIERVARGG